MNRANPIRIALGLVTTIALLGLGLLYLSTAQAQARERHAAVVIQFADGSVRTYCVSFTQDTISGFDALVKTGLEIEIKGDAGMGAEVCKIGPDGCDYPEEPCACESYRPDGVYWSYHHFKDGRWRPSTTGASSYKVRDGDIEGWAWSAGKPPSVTPTFNQLCNVTHAQATNTARPPTATRVPPRPTSTRKPPSPTRVAAAIPTAVRRSASPTATGARAQQDSQPDSAFPQQVETAPATLTTAPPGTSEQTASPPTPQPTQEQPIPTNTSATTAQPTQAQDTPVRVDRPTQTGGARTPTVAAPPTNPVSPPAGVPTDRPVATVRATVTTDSAPQPGATLAPTAAPSHTATIAPALEAPPTPALTSTPLASTPTTTAPVSIPTTTPIPGPRPPTPDSEDLARNIALAILAAVLVGLGVWALLRRRRATARRGGTDVD